MQHIYDSVKAFLATKQLAVESKITVKKNNLNISRNVIRACVFFYKIPIKELAKYFSISVYSVVDQYKKGQIVIERFEYDLLAKKKDIINDVFNSVAEKCGATNLSTITYPFVCSCKKNKTNHSCNAIVIERYMFAYICSIQHGVKNKDIAAFLKKDRTTILHAILQIQNYIDTGVFTKEEVFNIAQPCYSKEEDLFLKKWEKIFSYDFEEEKQSILKKIRLNKRPKQMLVAL